MKNKPALCIILALIMAILSASVFAEEEEDLGIAGFEVEKLLNFGSGLLAAGLLIATSIAYKRTGNKRLIYVSIAFLLFAVKGFLTSHELFFQEMPWIDPIAAVLNFAIILSFFFGVIKK